ncbi:MAG: porin [Ignavibacteriaceae bacterium]|nr:porin [Ignavibacteriaceae bacterium]
MKALFTAIFVLLLASFVLAQDGEKNWFQLYGFAMTDIGYNAKQIHPDWFDVVRPTKLPTTENEYGTDGNAYFSVRQTRFGVKSGTQTGLGELFTQFEWELFGTGVDAGQTTIRLRHAYGELGCIGVGQYWSPFMDIDVFPNTVEYWGPTGMAFFRNVQFRYMPIKGDTRLTIALERPGASADGGVISEILQEQTNLDAQFPVPDLSAEYRSAHDWGYVELAGIVRYIKWVDNTDYPPNVDVDLGDDVIGWGLNLSSNIKITKNDIARLSVVYGAGIQNYMNDAPVDIGVELDTTDAEKPVKGVALPILGVVAFLEHNWSEKFASAIGYSMVNIDNSDLQDYDAFKMGQYAIANLVYYPVENVMMAAELQWGMRDNFNNLEEDGEIQYPENYLKTADIFKVQFSFKYNFSHKVLF